MVTTGKGFQLNAESPEDKGAWKAAITAAIYREQQKAGVVVNAKTGASSSASSAAGAGGRGGGGGGGAIKGKDTRTFYVVGTEFVLDVRYELIKPIGHGAYGVVM